MHRVAASLAAEHPNLYGSMEHDVDEVGKRLDRYPNFNVEVSARTRNLTRQPTDKVRAFFLTYQDRILYGVDRAWRPHRTPDVLAKFYHANAQRLIGVR